MGEREDRNTDIHNRGSETSKQPNPPAPTSLFERIMMQTQKLQIFDKDNPSGKGKGFEVTSGSLRCTTNVKVTFREDALGIEGAKELIAFISSANGTLSEKIIKLNALTKYYSEDVSDLEVVVTGSLVKYCEKLLVAYCDPSSQIAEELCMLIPLLSLLLTYTNKAEEKKIDDLVKQSDFTYQLMRSSVMCVNALLSKTEELLRSTRKKRLAGRVRRVITEDTVTTLTRLLGIPSVPHHEYITPKVDVPLPSYRMTLFDTTSTITDKNLNQHIANMDLPKLSDQRLDVNLLSNISVGLNQRWNLEEAKEIWTDVVVAHVFPFEGLLTYMKGDWNCCLNLINRKLVEFVHSMEIEGSNSDQDQEIKIGSIVGFWSKDVKFKWKPPMRMQCFRGIVLGKAVSGLSENGNDVSWAIWAVDIGTLVIGKQVWLLEGEFTSLPPLISICSLNTKGKDEDRGESLFLLVALKLLARLLATNPNAGRHMVAYGSRKFEHWFDGITDDGNVCKGGVILKLIAYPEIEIRLEFLKLMLLLTRRSSEILRYLIECQFYLAVYNSLEICLYFCNAIASDNLLWSEIRLLIMLLSTMAEGSEMNMTELPGWNCIQQVLVMLTEIVNHPYVRYMAAKCLAVLENHKITKTRVDRMNTVGSSDQNFSKKHAVNQPEMNPAEVQKQTSKLSNASDQRPHECISPATNSVLVDSELREPVLAVVDVGDDPSSDEESLNFPPVDALEDMARQMDRYTKGYRVNICNDMTHELSEEKHVGQISENNLAKVVCGFLNNGVGGSVYFGINSKGSIEGMKMTRAERDNFRKGVDRLMTRSIFPEVRPACYDVNFVPVFGPGETVKGLASHGFWIIEMHIKALPHVIYTATSSRKCYVRKGSVCVESMSISLRQEAAEQNKKEILQSIEEVKAKIPQNREKLLKFVKDYLDQGKNLV